MPPRSVTDQDLQEMADLFRYGFHTVDIVMLYDISHLSLRRYMAKFGLTRRKGRPSMSSRPLIPDGARFADDLLPTPDQLLHSSARAQQDRRIAARRSDASICSCPEEVS